MALHGHNDTAARILKHEFLKSGCCRIREPLSGRLPQLDGNARTLSEVPRRDRGRAEDTRLGPGHFR